MAWDCLLGQVTFVIKLAVIFVLQRLPYLFRTGHWGAVFTRCAFWLSILARISRGWCQTRGGTRYHSGQFRLPDLTNQTSHLTIEAQRVWHTSHVTLCYHGLQQRKASSRLRLSLALLLSTFLMRCQQSTAMALISGDHVARIHLSRPHCHKLA